MEMESLSSQTGNPFMLQLFQNALAGLYMKRCGFNAFICVLHTETTNSLLEDWMLWQFNYKSLPCSGTEWNFNHLSDVKLTLKKKALLIIEKLKHAVDIKSFLTSKDCCVRVVSDFRIFLLRSHSKNMHVSKSEVKYYSMGTMSHFREDYPLEIS